VSDVDFSPTVRLAEPSDFGSVNTLFSESYSVLLRRDYSYQVLSPVLPFIAKAKPELLASGTYFVATYGRVVVGAGGWTAEPPGKSTAKPGVGHIRHVVTSHRHTRSGIASHLLGEVLYQARAYGMHRLECLSTRTAEPFYQAMGFRSVRPIDVAIAGKHRFPSIEMELNF